MPGVAHQTGQEALPKQGGSEVIAREGHSKPRGIGHQTGQGAPPKEGGSEGTVRKTGTHPNTARK